MTQKIDYKFVSCATCKYWSGNVKYIWPGTVEVNTDDKDQQFAPCNNTYFGKNTFIWASCSNWEAKFKI